LYPALAPESDLHAVHPDDATMNACVSPYDLPLYPRLHPASCHDSVSFVLSSVEFSQRFTLGTFDKILLNAAHEAIYRLIDHQNQEPIIDLNKRDKNNTDAGSGIQISPEGVPICRKGKIYVCFPKHAGKPSNGK
jgi:hypothetical protein